MINFLALLFAGLVFGEVLGRGTAGSSLRDCSVAASNLRIIDGDKANLKDFPYQLFIIMNKTALCGAVIYNSVWALTAAHCVDKYQRNPGHVMLYAGYWKRSSPDSTGAEQDFQVSEIHVHHEYNMTTFDYDIALLRIPEELKFSEFVKAVELSEGGDLTNKTAVVSGWGATHVSGNPNSSSEVLLKAEVRILPTEDCRAPNPAFNATIQICTGSGSNARRGPCNNDSGGPLVVRRKQGQELVGIVSYGLERECNLLGYPEFYTQVSYFIPWIKSTVKQLHTFVIS